MKESKLKPIDTFNKGQRAYLECIFQSVTDKGQVIVRRPVNMPIPPSNMFDVKYDASALFTKDLEPLNLEDGKITNAKDGDKVYAACTVMSFDWGVGPSMLLSESKEKRMVHVHLGDACGIPIIEPIATKYIKQATAPVITPKYALSESNTKILENGTKLYRIKALRNFGNVHKGQMGGYVQSEANLSHAGKCWIVEGNVFENATVKDNAVVRVGNIHGNVTIEGNSRIRHVNYISGSVAIKGNAEIDTSGSITGDIIIDGNTSISDKASINAGGIITDDVAIIGQVNITGNVVIINKVVICGKSNITGNVALKDNAFIRDTSIFNSEIDGDAVVLSGNITKTDDIYVLNSHKNIPYTYNASSKTIAHAHALNGPVYNEYPVDQFLEEAAAIKGVPLSTERNYFERQLRSIEGERRGI